MKRQEETMWIQRPPKIDKLIKTRNVKDLLKIIKSKKILVNWRIPSKHCAS